MRVLSILVLSLATVLPASGRALAQSSWIPYTAQFQESGTSALAGKTTPFLRTGNKARSTNGSTVEQEYLPGSSTVAKESLYDAVNHVAYTIDMLGKTALGKAINLAHFTTPNDSPIGYEVVGGVATTVYPIKNPKTNTVDGKIWIANGTDIIVRTAITFPSGGGTYLYQLENLKIGSQIAAELFSIPPGFAVTKPVS